MPTGHSIDASTHSCGGKGFRVAEDGDLSGIVLDRVMAYGAIVPRNWHDMADRSPAGAHEVHALPVPIIAAIREVRDQRQKMPTGI